MTFRIFGLSLIYQRCLEQPLLIISVLIALCVRAQVPAVVQAAEGASFEISLSIAADSGKRQVRNLIFSGVNLGLTYRNQFSELMRTRDDNIDAVIKDWFEVIDKTG